MLITVLLIGGLAWIEEKETHHILTILGKEREGEEGEGAIEAIR